MTVINRHHQGCKAPLQAVALPPHVKIEGLLLLLLLLLFAGQKII
jgi:hypothetical protein